MIIRHTRVMHGRLRSGQAQLLSNCKMTKDLTKNKTSDGYGPGTGLLGTIVGLAHDA
jgi:hypothetical protein